MAIGTESAVVTGGGTAGSPVRIGPDITLGERPSRTNRRGVTLPPGPRFSLDRMSGTGRERVPWIFRAISRQFPEVAYLGAFGQRIYVVSDPALVRQVLISDGKKVDKGQALRSANVVLGEGLITARRQLHLPRRRLVNPAFAHARMAGYAGEMVAAAESAGDRWRPGDRTDLAAEMSRLTLDIIGRTVFGADLDAQWERIGHDLTLGLRGWEVMMLPGGEYIVKLPLPPLKRFWAATDGLHDVVRDLLAGRFGAPKAAAADGVAPVGHAGYDSVVAAMRRARDDGAALDDAAMHDETMNLMLAGHETTALLLTWTFWLLAKHPEEAGLLRRSLRDTLGDRRPGYADLRELHRAYAVTAEVLRLFPPAWILEREVEQEIDLAGWRVPAGSTVLFSQFALHRDPRFWRDPDAFRPDRWLDAEGRFNEQQPGVPRGAWYPFGGGTRVCIGEQFAWTEAVLALAVLAPRWQVRLQPGHRPRLHAAITLRPADGMPVEIVPATD